MTDGSHKASVDIEARVDSADKDIKKLTRRINKMEQALARSQKAANGKTKSLQRIRGASTTTESALSKLASKIGLPGGGAGLPAAGIAGALIFATKAAFDFVRGMEPMADLALQTQAVFHNLEISIDPARKATEGFVNDMELATLASQATSLGVAKTSREFGELSGALARLGMSRGITALEGIESGIAAIGRGSTEMLDNLGISLKVAEAQREYAKQLGVSVKALSEQQKAEAFSVIAKQRVIEAAQGVDLASTKAAKSVKRLNVQLENVGYWALGAEQGTAALERAIAQLDKEQRISIESLQSHGSSLAELKRRLHDAGFSYNELSDNVWDYIGALRKARAEEAKQKKAAEEAWPEKRAEFERAMQEDSNKRRLKDVEREIASLEGLKKARSAVSDLQAEKAELLAKNAELSGNLDRAEEIRFREELRRLRESGQEAKRSHKEVKSLLEAMLEADQKRLSAFSQDTPDLSFLDSGLVDPFSIENRQVYLDELARIAETERAIENERRRGLLEDELQHLEMRREMGADPLAMIEQEQAARLAYNDFMLEQAGSEAERLRVQNERRTIHHKAELKRIREEKKQQQQRMRLYGEVGQSIDTVYRATAEAALASALSQGASVREAVKSTAKAEAMRAAITAGAATVQAVFWAAVPGGQAQAVQFSIAAGVAAAKAAAFGVLAGSLSGTREARSAGSGFRPASIGTGGGGIALGPGADSGGSDAAGSDSTVPGSTGRPGQPTTGSPSTKKDQQGINFDGAVMNFWGSPPEDFIESVKREGEQLRLKRR